MEINHIGLPKWFPAAFCRFLRIINNLLLFLCSDMTFIGQKSLFLQILPHIDLLFKYFYC